MRNVIAIMGVLFGAAMAVPAQDRFDLYLGYQFNRANFELKHQSFRFEQSTDTNGFNVSGTVFPGEEPGNVGITGEWAGNFTGGKDDSSFFTLMGGVTAQKRTGTGQPFVRGLVGVARTRLANEQFHNILDLSDVGLAFAVGGGVDIRLNKTFALRLVQADFVQTRHFGTHNNHLRLGAGIRF